MAQYHHISSLADEEHLLSKMIDLETKIREQKESQRLQKNTQNEMYTDIFGPIARRVESLKKPENVPIEPNVASDPVKTETVDLYNKVLQTIPKRSRDDGVLGLDAGRKLVNNRPYTVLGNVLTVQNEDGTKSVIEINDPNVWTLLLVQNPSIDTTSTDGMNAVKVYRNIADQLGFIPRVQYTNTNFKRRAKYKLLKPQGTGFLFSTKKPSSMTVVIPSDRKGLMRALLQAVAELRAGNESIRNLVVPLAQEAERKKILPKGLLTPEELTWIYA